VPPSAALAGAQRVLVGTSGWIYPHWRGPFYPADLPQSRWLSFLSSRLASVEINGTFYSLTTPRACKRWREQVPAEFVFAVKGSRYITHMKRLRDVRTALANFFASGILRLGCQLGPILWQLPAHVPFDPETAEGFLRQLPPDVRAAERMARRHDARVTGRAALTAPDGRDRRLHYVLEPRHSSWMGERALEILSRWETALVWADTAGKHPATTVQTTRTIAYVRLHGSRRIYEGHYTSEELESWARRAETWAGQGTRVFIYFDNDRAAAAALDAAALAGRLQGRAGLADPAPPKEPSTPRGERRRPPHFRFQVSGGQRGLG
jgi:uncharacterized protein YecE (DUF72 family)